MTRIQRLSLFRFRKLPLWEKFHRLLCGISIPSLVTIFPLLLLETNVEWSVLWEIMKKVNDYWTEFCVQSLSLEMLRLKNPTVFCRFPLPKMEFRSTWTTLNQRARGLSSFSCPVEEKSVQFKVNVASCRFELGTVRPRHSKRRSISTGKTGDQCGRLSTMVTTDDRLVTMVIMGGGHDGHHWPPGRHGGQGTGCRRNTDQHMSSNFAH